MATMIIVPKTERGVDGVIKNVHDALMVEREVVFAMNYPLAHTVVARILSEINPPIPPVAPPIGPTIKVNIRKTLIRAFGKRYLLETNVQIREMKKNGPSRTPRATPKTHKDE